MNSRSDEDGGAMPPKPPELEDGADDARTVSGLDESQIDAADLEQLRKAVVLHTCDLKSSAKVRALPDAQLHIAPTASHLHSLQLGGASAGVAKQPVGLHELRAVYKQLELGAATPRIRKGLDAALSLAVRRRRLLEGELSREREKALYRALYQKLGEEAHGLEVRAVFAHVPPEAADSVSVDRELRWASFCLPAGWPASRARGGFYLVVLRGEGNKTRRLLLRL
jgi:hypothetical protein